MLPHEIVDRQPIPQEFLDSCLLPGRPLVVRSALADWNWATPWDPAELVRRFGDAEVPLFDTLFALEDVSTLTEYLAEREGSTAGEVPPYVRWFAKQSAAQELCADEAFAELAEDWSVPAWLPKGDYVFPRYPGRADAARDPFPAKGLFVCGAGGRTRLHVDPWASDACLCQAAGTKRFVMYPPEAGHLLTDDSGAVVDLDRPDEVRFPRWREAVPALDLVLGAGDAIFIPAGWYHTAIALTDSISITWNFIHRVHEERFQKFLAVGGAEDPVVAYFQSLG